MSGKQGEWCRIGVMVGVCEWGSMGYSLGDEPQTLIRCHSCRLSQLYEAGVCKPVFGRAYNLKDINGKIYFSSFLS